MDAINTLFFSKAKKIDGMEENTLIEVQIKTLGASGRKPVFLQKAEELGQLIKENESGRMKEKLEAFVNSFEPKDHRKKFE